MKQKAFMSPLVLDAAEQLLPELVLKSISRKPSVAWRASFQNLHLADRFTTTSSTFGYLLSWMALFDHFEDLTFQLKVGYIAHLRSLDAEFSRYLETLFTLLRVGSQSSTAVMFDLSKWDYEFYMVQGI